VLDTACQGSVKLASKEYPHQNAAPFTGSVLSETSIPGSEVTPLPPFP
jgi:hypothetical protein